MDIGTLPRPPTNHSGYALVKSADLPLEVFSASANTAPVFTDGTSTTRTIAEDTATDVNIGTAIAATDANNDVLTYTLGGTDATAFAMESTTGQLKTSAALDYETKNSYSVTITVSDGNGGSASITVTINITDVDEGTEVTTYNVGDAIPFPTGFLTPQLIIGSGRAITAANGTYTCVATVNCIIANGAVSQGSIEVTTSAARDDTPIVSGSSLVCDRTPQVRDAIVAAVSGVSTCNDVTETHLAAIETLNLIDKSITSLKDGDFDGLSALTVLYLHSNQLTTLSAECV